MPPPHWEADIVAADGGHGAPAPDLPGGRRASRRPDGPQQRPDPLLPVLRPDEAALRQGPAPVHPRRPRRPGGVRGAPGRADRRGRAGSTAIPARTTPRSPSSSRTPTRAAASARCCSSTWPPPPASAGSRTSSPRCWPRTAGWCGSSRTPGTRPSGPTRTASSTSPSRSSRPRTRSPSPTSASSAASRGRSPGCSRRRRWRSSAPATTRARSATRCCGTCSTYGFAGPVYPVNPGARHVRGVPAYADIESIPDDVDLAVLAVPADEVAGVVEACRRKRRAGPGRGLGRVRGDRTRRPRRASGSSWPPPARPACGWSGPNCLGIVNTDPERAAQREPGADGPRPRPGRASSPSPDRSGSRSSNGPRSRNLGLSTFVSAGNRADVSGNDLLQYWATDPGTEPALRGRPARPRAEKARGGRRPGLRPPAARRHRP